MSANNALHIAVLGGDGIGPEVMAPALEVLRRIEKTTDLKFRFTEAPAGANHYRETGKSMPESTVRLCDEADAILLGACGLPSVRYPDNTEIMPQVELRFHFDLYAGVRPARLIPGVPSPIVGADQRGIDLVVIRESTEGLFASMGKGVVTDTEARETLVITRRTSERLFEFSFRLAERRKARRGPIPREVVRNDQGFHLTRQASRGDLGRESVAGRPADDGFVFGDALNEQGDDLRPGAVVACPVAAFNESSGRGFLEDFQDGVEEPSRIRWLTTGRFELPFHRQCTVHS